MRPSYYNQVAQLSVEHGGCWPVRRRQAHPITQGGGSGLCTGDVAVTREDMLGRGGPSLVSGRFTQDGGAALACLDRLAGLPAARVLPGHGPAFAGGPRTAAARARTAGLR